MLLRKKGFLPPSTKKNSADRGQIGAVTGLFACLFFMILVSAELQRRQYAFLSYYLEDALAASNLASALIDVEEYGKTHKLFVKNPSEAFEVYRWALKENLRLSDTMEGNGIKGMEGQVEITDYRIYNVDGDEVDIYIKIGDCMKQEHGRKGEVRAPSGETICETGIYSEVEFMTIGIFQIRQKARKGKLVEVIMNESN